MCNTVISQRASMYGVTHVALLLHLDTFRWMGCAEFAPGTWLPHDCFSTTISFCLAC